VDSVSKSTIVLIEDNKQIKDIIEELLSDHGYEVKSFGDGVAACDYIRKNKPTAVISDYVMPSISGIEIAKNVHKWHGDIPLVILTGLGLRDIRKITIPSFVTVMLKPFKDDEFLQAIAELLTKRPLDQAREIAS
jgi:CheY-like chemotaxis protein